MNDQAKRIGVRIAANSLQLLLADGGFNVYKLVTIVDNAFQENRQPTDDELLAASTALDQKIERVFSMDAPPDTSLRNTVALRGAEPNDRGHDEH